jgi:hypothetical protein
MIRPCLSLLLFLLVIPGHADCANAGNGNPFCRPEASSLLGSARHYPSPLSEEQKMRFYAALKRLDEANGALARQAGLDIRFRDIENRDMLRRTGYLPEGTIRPVRCLFYLLSLQIDTLDRMLGSFNPEELEKLRYARRFRKVRSTDQCNFGDYRDLYISVFFEKIGDLALLYRSLGCDIDCIPEMPVKVQNADIVYAHLISEVENLSDWATRLRSQWTLR